jgi:hypothetical protein
MKKLWVLLLVSILSCAQLVNAQSDSDTDPNRWQQVKSWKGTFTFKSKESVTTQADVLLIHTTDISLDGAFTLNYQVAQTNFYTTWEGKGKAGGPVFWKQETKALDGSMDCIFVQKDDPLVPLVDTPGYSLDWFRDGPHKGEYVFTTGEITIPASITYGCDGETSTESQDFELGGGSSYYQPLPASGYRLTGDVVMPDFNGFNDAQFHWDLQPNEFYPESSNPCAAEAIYGDNSVQTHLLREYRDNVLNKTPEGQILIKLYYLWSPLVVKAIQENEDFKKTVKEMIDEILIANRRDG